MLADTMSADLRRRRDEALIQWLVDDGQYGVALKALRAGARDLPGRLKEVEILRRSCGAGVLELASELCENLKNEVHENSSLSFRSWHSYEAGYVALLLGYPRHREALETDTASGPSPDREGPWLASAALIVQSLIADAGRLANWREIDDLVVRSHQIIAQSHHGDDTRRRWVDNWRWHDVRIWLVRGEKERCLTALRLAQQHAETNTLDTKHDRLGLAIRLSIEGSVAATFAETEGDAKAALQTLAQALVLQVGQSRRYPEMVRDVLFCTAHVLPMTGDADAEARASRIAAVATRTRDGSSWIHPYVASS